MTTSASDPRGAGTPEVDVDAAVLPISVAAELAGMHPQTLRQYDRLGLVEPRRSAGRGRRYSLRDVATLREVQRLSQEDGVNLAGIKRILELERRVLRLSDEVERLRALVGAQRRVFTADPSGDVVAGQMGRRVSRSRAGAALVLWDPRRR
ncbi:helix-turn-helix transcriptional regulator [Pseudokineococcus marinus]|uniref:Helix-turn-helix transcriptional regulator n=1 Tax=Pseudokineococcus marinus TaxID=351215 RepID=A0A849BRT4_9ACTN|nr:helix-turn-helix transcriptional regulator [Pseudokineococcus marinus]NNH23194.1 helix-turn-helix transcriptional regulator [Pseudokineococcus marinus]